MNNQEKYKLRKNELKEMYSDFLTHCFRIGMQDEVSGTKVKTGIELYNMHFKNELRWYPNVISRAFKSSYNAGRQVEKYILQPLLNEEV